MNPASSDWEKRKANTQDLGFTKNLGTVVLYCHSEVDIPSNRSVLQLQEHCSLRSHRIHATKQSNSDAGANHTHPQQDARI